MMATVYLTDGFDRLPFTPKVVAFTLGPDWVAHGETSWRWVGDSVVTIAGWEVELHTPEHQRAHYQLEPTILEPRQSAHLALRIEFERIDQELPLPEMVGAGR